VAWRAWRRGGRWGGAWRGREGGGWLGRSGDVACCAYGAYSEGMTFREMRVRVPLEVHRAAKAAMVERGVQGWNELVKRLLEAWTKGEGK
jgi:hypothetical protein